METIKQHLQGSKENNQYRLIYDRWKCPNSTVKEQVKTDVLDYETLVKEYGDFIYTGGYTTGNLSEGGFSIDLWAIATEERKYEYPMVINPKEKCKSIFDKALEDEEGLEIYEEKNNILGYWDEKNAYERIFYFDDTIASLSDRVLMDEQVEKFIDKKAFVEFLMECVDHNSLMVMNKLALIYDPDGVTSSAREQLEEYTSDEYSWYICEGGDDQIGCTWVERQIPVINVSNLLISAKNIADDPDEWRNVEYIFTEGILQTIFHELRHLFYECNEIIPIGADTPYPWNGGYEDEVEDYGNLQAEKYISKFNTEVIKGDVLHEEMSKMIAECCEDYEKESIDY